MTEMIDLAAFWEKHPPPWKAEYWPRTNDCIRVVDSNCDLVLSETFCTHLDAEERLRTYEAVTHLASQYAAAERLKEAGKHLLVRLSALIVPQGLLPEVKQFEAALDEWEKVRA